MPVCNFSSLVFWFQRIASATTKTPRARTFIGKPIIVEKYHRYLAKALAEYEELKFPKHSSNQTSQAQLKQAKLKNQNCKKLADGISGN